MTNAERIQAAMYAQNFDGPSNIGKSGGELATFTFSVTNTAGAGVRSAELFGPNRSVMEIQRTDFTGLTAAAFTYATGAAVLTYTAETVTISSSTTNFPYRQFFNSLRTNVYNLVKLRVQCTTAAQQNRAFNLCVNSGLGGRIFNDLGTPATWKKPENNQALITDIDLNVKLDQQTTLDFSMEGGETVQITLFCQNWNLPNV